MMRYVATYRALLGAALLAMAAPALAEDGGARVDAGATQGPQSFTVEAPKAVKFGEPFPYTVRVTHAKGEVYALPRDPDLGEFDLATAQKQDLPNGQNVTTVFELQLRPWTVGKKNIPDLKLEVQSASGASSYTVPGPEVEVAGTLPDAGSEEALRDIAPPVDIPVRTYRLLYALAVALGVGLLAYALMRYLRRPRPVVSAPLPPPEPLDVRARRALEALLAEDLAGKGRQRELYFRLSEIVRRYLGERFGFDALDLTTEELLAALRKRPTPGLDLAAFARESQEADLVKFAKLQPDANACKGSVDAAIAMVNATTAARASEVRSA